MGQAPNPLKYLNNLEKITEKKREHIMSKKIISITEQELINAINVEGLGNGHPYESELCMHGGNDAYGLNNYS